MNLQILVVEDDVLLQDLTCKFLRREGWAVDACANGDDALELIYDNDYHLIILDIMIPGMNGHELLKEIRRIRDTPVLMMTALSDDENQLRAFDNHADDYVTKPFSMQILVKRAEALLRRSGMLRNEIAVGRLTLFLDTYAIEYDGKTIALTPKELEILELFMRSAGKIITHETLLTRIWGYDFDGNEGIVHASIKKLRDKLPCGIIRTVKGVGYCLEVRDDENKG